MEADSFFMAEAKVEINILKNKGPTIILGFHLSYFSVHQLTCSSGFAL